MTRRESAILTAFTGVLCGPFEAFHEYAEELMGRPVFTHEFGSEVMSELISEKSKDDFYALCEAVD